MSLWFFDVETEIAPTKEYVETMKIFIPFMKEYNFLDFGELFMLMNKPVTR